eukprot:g1210.t1
MAAFSNAKEVTQIVQPLAPFLASFKKGLRTEILEMDDEHAVFELAGIDASIANALRRIMIAEVPTMAITEVNVKRNSSVMQDEVLVSRLGLIPLRVDPNRFEERPANSRDFTDANTLVFNLKVMCTAKPGRVPRKIDTDYDDLENGQVFSSAMTWVPQGRQGSWFKDVRPVHEDILLTKLRPGQELDLELYAMKNSGSVHAKYSPVCTASYRQMPKVWLSEDVFDDRAARLNELMPNVFDIQSTSDGRRKAVVRESRNCTMSKNFMAEEDLARAVHVERVPNHYIFSVETTGQISPAEIFTQALDILSAKCDRVLEALSSPNGLPQDNARGV